MIVVTERTALLLKKNRSLGRCPNTPGRDSVGLPSRLPLPRTSAHRLKEHTTCPHLHRIASRVLGVLLSSEALRQRHGGKRGRRTAAPAPAQMREDLTVLQEKLATLDRSFDDRERQQFEKLVDEAAQNTEHLDAARFELSMSRAVAVARNGHTNSSVNRFVHYLPLRLWWFSGWSVRHQGASGFRRSCSGLGSRRSAPSRPNRRWRAPAALHFRNGYEHPSEKPAYLIALELLREIGATRSEENVRVAFTLRDGKRRTVALGSSPHTGSRAAPETPMRR